ncbi:MAG: hypothetical protein JXA67_07340 [Micromonosporaceae bacterium]|nr:hypothetical protein [Micromonosporaceae bacterium]
MRIDFAPDRSQHDAGLVIRYRGVTGLAVDASPVMGVECPPPAVRSLGSLQIDEILPHEQGCSHEILMTGGTIRVVCADLEAEWHAVTASADGLGMDGEHL